MKSDRQLIVRINKLEKDLLISEAECTMVNENLKSTKEKVPQLYIHILFLVNLYYHKTYCS